MKIDWKSFLRTLAGWLIGLFTGEMASKALNLSDTQTKSLKYIGAGIGAGIACTIDEGKKQEHKSLESAVDAPESYRYRKAILEEREKKTTEIRVK